MTTLFAAVQLLVLLLLRLMPNSSAGDSSSSSSSSSVSITNPYYSGCLREKLAPPSNYSKLRVCNGDDPHPSAMEQGYCRPPNFEESYMEIRINAGNWDSPIIAAWLIQIILSEILGVPTSVEAGSYAESRNFYEPQDRTDYTTSSYVDFLAAPSNYSNGDCRLAIRTADHYEPCAHFNPEHWHVEHANVTRQLQAQGIDPPQNSGSLGHETWFITKFAVEQDPTLVSYLGLRGEQNRQKLAQTFKRPTTWRDYCQEVSLDNCTTPDNVAQRPPETESEGYQYYQAGHYMGHFRLTPENDCEANPTTCTGHIANYPCEWPSYMESNLYHLNIPLKHAHYSYGRALEMWHAANATKSPLIMMWWTPEPLYQRYLGTDAEMIQVILPPQTQACVNVRPVDECSETLVDRVGPPAAACSQAPKPLSKMISSVLQELELSTPDAIKSPAYQVLQVFQLREVQLNELFGLWTSAPTPRSAVCQWAAEHLHDFLLLHVPPTFPRVSQVQQDNNESNLLSYAATAFASFATLAILITSVAVRKHQNTKASLLYAQVEFLWFLLAGSLFITIGATVASLPSVRITTGTCVASIWLICLGYTLELVPLIVKVAAINRLMSGAERMRRVTLPRRQLYGAVMVISVFCIVYLILWTILDPPSKNSEYTLTEQVTSMGEHVVAQSYYCQDGNASGWKFAAVGWNVILLLCASVLAFQTRDIIKTFNESRTLAILIYSHLMFVVLRCATYFLDDYLQGTTLNYVRSLLYSLDTLATVIIYFVPKLLTKGVPGTPSSRFIVSGHNTINSNLNINNDSNPLATNSSKPFGSSSPLTNSNSNQNNSGSMPILEAINEDQNTNGSTLTSEAKPSEKAPLDVPVF